MCRRSSGSATIPQTLEANHVPSDISSRRGDRADRRCPLPPGSLYGRDNVKPAANKDPEKKDSDKFDKVDIGDIEETPPAGLDVGPDVGETGQRGSEAEYNDDSKAFEHKGNSAANGSADKPADGSRKAMLATGGGTKHTERAVTAALVWLANHQEYDGHWSLTGYAETVQGQDLYGRG